MSSSSYWTSIAKSWGDEDEIITVCVCSFKSQHKQKIVVVELQKIATRKGIFVSLVVSLKTVIGFICRKTVTYEQNIKCLGAGNMTQYYIENNERLEKKIVELFVRNIKQKTWGFSCMFTLLPRDLLLPN